jgi:hypothetical protein
MIKEEPSSELTQCLYMADHRAAHYKTCWKVVQQETNNSSSCRDGILTGFGAK